MAGETRIRSVVADADDGGRLDAVVGRRAEETLDRPLSRSTVRRMIVAGAVSVNRRVERRPARTVAAGDVITASVRAEHARPRTTPDCLQVLLEDAWLLAVAKPAGLPTAATADPDRPHLVGLVLRHLRESGHDPYVAVHQRLDRDTTGVVLFAVDRAANASLADQFERHAIEKTYLALTARPRHLPPATWADERPLAAVGGGRSARMAPSPDGQPARTDFSIIEKLPRALLVEARPRTGRKHQVRAHLAASSLPILGDVRYGAPSSPGAPRVLLHAARLRLTHPVTGVPLVIEAPLPADFAGVLARLRAETPAAHGRQR